MMYGVRAVVLCRPSPLHDVLGGRFLARISKNDKCFWDGTISSLCSIEMGVDCSWLEPMPRQVLSACRMFPEPTADRDPESALCHGRNPALPRTFPYIRFSCNMCSSPALRCVDVLFFDPRLVLHPSLSLFFPL